MAFQYLRGTYEKDGDELFSRACCVRTSGNGFKLKEGRSTMDIRKKSFRMRVVKHWNRLPREMVDASPLKTLKVRLDGALSSPVHCRWIGLYDLYRSILTQTILRFYDSMKTG